MPDLNNRRDVTAPDGQIGRRAFLKGMTAVSAGAIGARGAYELLEKYGVTRTAPAAAAGATVRRLQEQYLIQQIEAVLDNGVTCAIPPLHNDVITAKLKTTRTWNTSALKAAQTRLENALSTVESPYPDTAAGLTIVVGWGLPFIRTFLPATLQARLPVDVALSKQTGSTRYAVLDAVKFPSDPDPVLLEDNHVMFKFRSDSPDILRKVETALFDDTSNKAYVGDLFDLTSKRIGFLGRGFGTTSVGKTLAVAAGVPGAEQIPDNAQLMLGFTSTQTAALGPGNIVSFETLPGVTDQWPNGYFAAGCAMHLSHLYEDLSAWYTSPYASRVNRMFSPHTPVPTNQSTVTLPNGPADVTSRTQLDQDASGGTLGHNETLQQATRLAANITDNYGQTRPAGTAVHVVGRPGPRRLELDRSGRHAFCGIRAGQQQVPRCAQRHGRSPARRHQPARRPVQHHGRQQRHQRRYSRFAPAELPHPTPATPLLPACRTAHLVSPSTSIRRSCGAGGGRCRSSATTRRSIARSGRERTLISPTRRRSAPEPVMRSPGGCSTCPKAGSASWAASPAWTWSSWAAAPRTSPLGSPGAVPARSASM
jgi:hypothetical protein